MTDFFLTGATCRISTSVSSVVTKALADPGGLVCKIRKPDKSLVTLTYGVDVAVIKDSTGKYHFDILLDQVGIWHWRWEASNPNSGVVEDQLTVQASHVL